MDRLSQAFHRAKGNDDMTRQVFQDRVIGEEFPRMPFILWSRLFTFLDVDNADKIELKHFICLMAIIMRGTKKEKAKLCFVM